MDRKYIEHAIEAMDEEELIRIIKNIVKHTDYEENSFTGMVKDIANKTQLSSKQKEVLKMHLKIYHRLWY